MLTVSRLRSGASSLPYANPNSSAFNIKSLDESLTETVYVLASKGLANVNQRIKISN